ncbi:hypothetical protein [Aestuariibacter sp. A3R04]|uniref:hypothetical protein n=1 Tax=Aestuariibacter sp. A3R04 TaxID=2841571 RepID=UPI001C081D17|nr:hypothetical protein [Aestuariibacter sp. A3R04]MBU3021994.1 hypothetical protein [Aestuariibacter sp. A3R04]
MMKFKMLAASLVLSSTFIASSAMANESPLESFLSHMVERAVTVAGNEIESGVRQSVVNATYHFSLDSDQQRGSVSVTDIADSGKEAQPSSQLSEDE